jgi:hypothetical protein
MPQVRRAFHVFRVQSLRHAARCADLVLLLVLAGCAGAPQIIPPIAGTVWQIDSHTVDPTGTWQRMGATELLVQWTAVDGLSYVDDPVMPRAARLPQWQRIAGEPWAQDVILGLAGRYDERAARADIAGLAAASARLAQLPTPLHVVAYYFPVEIDPSWAEAASLAPLLASLPRPLWISVYDRANVGPERMLQYLEPWLPADVGIFFQDGVGTYAREPGVARHYADVLTAGLGQDRVRIIAEAFRPDLGGRMRSATIAELRAQLARYDGYRVYLFEGPHYLPDALVAQIIASQAAASGAKAAP